MARAERDALSYIGIVMIVMVLLVLLVGIAIFAYGASAPNQYTMADFMRDYAPSLTAGGQSL
ncbi:MAG: hypothetical protein PHI27_08935 [Eubacteriales bacterium]|nr:hypothetical protein [Eubacteriales bacterium]MDD3882364.1 hypothetical protein [Eubacteriales bacterium]MDD4512415.1 hypothetical protein [Eubacteriales bacterium]